MSITATIDAGGDIVVQLGAEQGLAGAPGPAGGAGAEYTAAAALSGHQAIALDSAGQAIYASADNPAHALAVAGISLGAAALGDPITVVSAGLVEHSGWAWAPGELVYLGTGGALVQTEAPGAVFLQVLGQALSATRVLVALQPPIVLTP